MISMSMKRKRRMVEEDEDKKLCGNLVSRLVDGTLKLTYVQFLGHRSVELFALRGPKPNRTAFLLLLVAHVH